jgi:3-hydroxybutyryl-CoA dehydratase
MSELAYEDIKVGDEASLTRTITEVHIVNYAGLTGDWNPVHADAEKVVVTVTDKRDEKRIIKLRTAAYNQRGEMVIDGSAAVKNVGL